LPCFMEVSLLALVVCVFLNQRSSFFRECVLDERIPMRTKLLVLGLKIKCCPFLDEFFLQVLLECLESNCHLQKGVVLHFFFYAFTNWKCEVHEQLFPTQLLLLIRNDIWMVFGLLTLRGFPL